MVLLTLFARFHNGEIIAKYYQESINYGIVPFSYDNYACLVGSNLLFNLILGAMTAL